MPLPSPFDYDNWQDFASALLSSLGDGNDDVIAGSATTAGTTGSAGGGITTTPPGFDAVYWNSALDHLFVGNSFLTAPPIVTPFTIDTQSLALASVTLGILADNAVDMTKLADGAVDTGAIQDFAVVNAKIGNLAVTNAKILDATILTAKIGDAQILTAKIGDAQIVTAKIGDLQVTNAKIGDLAVNMAKIANASIDQARIALLAVGAAQIIDLSVGTAKIGLLAVTAAQIADATITTAKIGSAQITTALIGSAQITTALIGAAQIVQALIANAAIGSAQIAALAVGTAAIQDAAITSAKIASLVIDKVTAGTLDAVIDMGTGLIRFTIGGNRLVLGKGFGTTSQFIMWFGPNMAENLMTEGAAIFYLRTDGSAYFGGSLSAGTIYNAGRSTLASDTGFVLGPFTSAGHSVTINSDIDLVGWIAQSSSFVEVNGDSSGSPADPYTSAHDTIRATYTLDKSPDGTSWTNIATYSQDVVCVSSKDQQGAAVIDSPSPGDVSRTFRWRNKWTVAIHQSTTATLTVGSTDYLRITRTVLTDLTTSAAPVGGVQTATHGVREVEA